MKIDITIGVLEAMCRELYRIEFSNLHPFTVECAQKSRKEVEELINQLRHESEQA